MRDSGVICAQQGLKYQSCACIDRSIVFLLHIALDVPMAIQGLWSPLALPFLQMTNTTLVFIKAGSISSA